MENEFDIELMKALDGVAGSLERKVLVAGGKVEVIVRPGQVDEAVKMLSALESVGEHVVELIGVCTAVANGQMPESENGDPIWNSVVGLMRAVPVMDVLASVQCCINVPIEHRALTAGDQAALLLAWFRVTWLQGNFRSLLQQIKKILPEEVQTKLDLFIEDWSSVMPGLSETP